MVEILAKLKFCNVHPKGDLAVGKSGKARRPLSKVASTSIRVVLIYVRQDFG